MLTLEKFTNYIERIKTAQEYDNEVLELSKKWVDKNVLFDYASTSVWYLVPDLIELLSLAMGVNPKDDDILDYWVSELNFGKEWSEGCIEDRKLPEEHKYRKPKLQTVEEIYEYLIFVKSQLEQSEK